MRAVGEIKVRRKLPLLSASAVDRPEARRQAASPVVARVPRGHEELGAPRDGEVLVLKVLQGQTEPLVVYQTRTRWWDIDLAVGRWAICNYSLFGSAP